MFVRCEHCIFFCVLFCCYCCCMLCAPICADEKKNYRDSCWYEYWKATTMGSYYILSTRLLKPMMAYTIEKVTENCPNQNNKQHTKCLLWSWARVSVEGVWDSEHVWMYADVYCLGERFEIIRDAHFYTLYKSDSIDNFLFLFWVWCVSNLSS